MPALRLFCTAAERGPEAGFLGGIGLAGPDIFLSYARTDRAVARVFADCFAHEGFSVWWDASLHSGETFDEVIEKNLRDSRAVVVLWSPRSVASRWVRAEATQADRRNKLAPAIIEPCDRPIIFELTHAAELSGWTGDTSDIRWRTFMEDLRRLVERSAAAQGEAAPAAPAPAVSVDPGPAARRPLRPGSDEVILAGRTPERSAPAAQPVRLPAAHKPEADESLDVHYLEVDGGEPAFALEAASLKIGRSAPADIVIPDKSVSREHCMLGIANDELFVTDLNSTNGTYIDGERIGRATILPVGSELRIGQVSLRHVVRPRDDGAWNGDAPRVAAAG